MCGGGDLGGRREWGGAAEGGAPFGEVIEFLARGVGKCGRRVFAGWVCARSGGGGCRCVRVVWLVSAGCWHSGEPKYKRVGVQTVNFAGPRSLCCPILAPSIDLSTAAPQAYLAGQWSCGPPQLLRTRADARRCGTAPRRDKVASRRRRRRRRRRRPRVRLGEQNKVAAARHGVWGKSRGATPFLGQFRWS